MKNSVYIFILLFLVNCCLFFGCEEAQQNRKPTCTITRPVSEAKIFQDTTLNISVNAKDKDGSVKKIRLFLDGRGLAFRYGSSLKYEWRTSDVSTGSHTLKAKAFDNSGAISEDEIQVSIGNVLKPSFSADTTLISIGDTVNFRSQSTGGTDKMEWHFGDGKISNNRNPSHVYPEKGSYSVKLTVSNAYGSRSRLKEDYITVIGETGTFTDERDGREYEWVKIGDQVWMAENLNYALDDRDAGNDWCYKDIPENCDVYGRLYSWEAVIQGERSSTTNPSGVQGVCPDGWHLPSDDEWKELEKHLGMSHSEAQKEGWGTKRGTNEGSKLAGEAELWNEGPLKNNEAFGSSGFTAIPGGFRWDLFTDRTYFFMGHSSIFWTCTVATYSLEKWVRRIPYNNKSIYRYSESRDFRMSVRCVRNN